MARFFPILLLIGTLPCIAAEPGSESKQVERRELQLAVEQYAREHRDTVPDLRIVSVGPLVQADRNPSAIQTDPSSACVRDAKGRINRVRDAMARG